MGRHVLFVVSAVLTATDGASHGPRGALLVHVREMLHQVVHMLGLELAAGVMTSNSKRSVKVRKKAEKKEEKNEDSTLAIYFFLRK